MFAAEEKAWLSKQRPGQGQGREAGRQKGQQDNAWAQGFRLGGGCGDQDLADKGRGYLWTWGSEYMGLGCLCVAEI